MSFFNLLNNLINDSAGSFEALVCYNNRVSAKIILASSEQQFGEDQLSPRKMKIRGLQRGSNI